MSAKRLAFSFLILLLLSPFSHAVYGPKKVHHVFGFYPQTKEALLKDIADSFAKARANFGVNANANLIKAVIAPHAGYSYSGVCAASAYQTLFEQVVLAGRIKNRRIKRVVILAPSHSVSFSGIALPDYSAYETPLGSISVDREAVEQLSKKSPFWTVPDAHDVEHSLEVQLPFLQSAIHDFKMVPLIVGALTVQDYVTIAEELKKVVDRTTLVVISSDFTHHGKNYGYQKFTKDIFYHIRRLDSSIIEAILEKSYVAWDQLLRRTGATVCGRNCINLLLKMIEQGVFGGIEGRLTSYYTSGQVSIAKRHGFIAHKLFENVLDNQMANSVSYAGIIFTQQKLVDLPLKDRLTGYERRALLQSARDAIANAFRSGPSRLQELLLAPVLTPMLKTRSGAFVTLKTKDDMLRGCVGDILPKQSLYLTVLERAKSAAFNDSRFLPLIEREVRDVVIDITVLSVPEEVENYKNIVIGHDGIILKKGGRSAVFLPQVPTEFGWNLNTTLEHLSMKAGLSKDGWKHGAEFEVFEGVEFTEPR